MNERKWDIIREALEGCSRDLFDLDHFAALKGQYVLHLWTADILLTNTLSTENIEVVVKDEKVAEWVFVPSDSSVHPTSAQKNGLKYMTEACIEKALYDKRKENRVILQCSITEVLSHKQDYTERIKGIIDCFHEHIPCGFIEMWDANIAQKRMRLLARKTGNTSTQHGTNVLGFNELELGRGVVGWTAKYNRPSLISDVNDPNEWVDGRNYVDVGINTRSELALPFRQNWNEEERLLIINFESPETKYFDSEHVKLIQSASQLLAKTLNDGDRRERETRDEALKAFREDMNSKDLDLVDLSVICAERLPRLIEGVDFAEVMLHDLPNTLYPNGALWRCGVGYGENYSAGEGGTSPLFPSEEEDVVPLEISLIYKTVAEQAPFIHTIGEWNGQTVQLMTSPVIEPRDRKEVLACIAIYQFDNAPAFTRFDEEMLADISECLAVAITQHQVHRISQAAELASSIDPTKYLDATAREVARLVNGKSCSIFERSGNQLYLRGTTGIIGSPPHGKVSYTIGYGMTGGIAKSGKALRVQRKKALNTRPEIQMLHLYSEEIGDVFGDCEEHGWIGVPVLNHDVVIGVIRLYAKEYDDPFTIFDQRVLEAFANHLAAIWNAQYSQKRRIDSLTELSKLFSEKANDDKSFKLRKAVQLAMEAVNADIGLIALKDEREQFLRFEIYEVRGGDRQWEARAKQQTRVATEKSLVGQVYKTQEDVYYPKMAGTNANPIHPKSIASITVPLTGRVTRFGVLACDSFREGAFTEEDVETFRIFGRLIGALLDLEYAEVEKEGALAELTHQLGSHLNALRMQSLYLNKTMPPEQIESVRLTLDATTELMAMTVYNVKHLKSILNDEKLVIQPSRQPLYPLLKRAATLYQPSASNTGIKIEVVECDDVVYAYFDQSRFAHAYYNLIDNAVKYSVESSVIRVSVDNTENESVTICVANRGIPIEADELKKIFEKGYRAENVRNTDIVGTGLGLALARKMVSLHRGAIWAETSSRRGDGTAELRFYIKLPKNAPLTVMPEKGDNR